MSLTRLMDVDGFLTLTRLDLLSGSTSYGSFGITGWLRWNDSFHACGWIALCDSLECVGWLAGNDSFMLSELFIVWW